MTKQTKIIKGDLILKKDTTFKTSIKVKGNIIGYYNLKVIGNIDALNIDARNIDALNIGARNIICCDKIKVKLKVICKFLIKDRFSIEKKEWKL